MAGSFPHSAIFSDINVKSREQRRKVTVRDAAQSLPVPQQETATWHTTNANLGGLQSQAIEVLLLEASLTTRDLQSSQGRIVTPDIR